MSFCKKCGTENSSSNIFCKKCGEKISVSNLATEDELRKEVEKLQKELNLLKEEKTKREKEEKIKGSKKEAFDKKKIKKERQEFEDNLEKIKEEIKDEISSEIKEDALIDIKEEVSDEIKKEVRTEVKNELSETMELIGLKEVINQKKSRSSSPLLLFLMIVVVAFAYLYFSYLFGPKNIAKEYLEAIKDNDYASLYEYENIVMEDSTFVNESNYLEVLKNQMDLSGRLIDYEIEDVVYSSDGKTAVVKTVVTYLKDNSEYKDNLDIELYRESEKKFIIFYTWHIKDNSSIGMNVIEDYRIYVPNGALVTFDGIELGKNYLESDNDSLIDVYRLPCVLEKNIELKVVLSNGIEIVKNVVPSDYYKEYRLNINDNDIKEDKNILNDTVMSSFEFIVNSGFSGKDFTSLSDVLSNDFVLESLENKYADYLTQVNGKNVEFSDFEIIGMTIQSIEFNHLYQYVVNVKIDYTWDSYLNGNKSSKKDFGFYTINLNYEDGKYRIVDIDQFPNFSIK